jgi:hypothetical protein
VIEVSVLRLLLVTLIGWLDRREREALAYLIEENRLLRRQVGRRRLRFKYYFSRAHTLFIGLADKWVKKWQ